jgi:TPP-dependent indolepyruvate ferredoxin oxidoreductase alpha subunit
MFASHLIDHYKSVGWAGAVSDTDRLETIQKTDSVNSERSVSKPSLMEVSEGDVKLPVEPSHPYTCDICMHSKEFDKIEYVIRHLNNHVAELTSTRVGCKA